MWANIKAETWSREELAFEVNKKKKIQQKENIAKVHVFKYVNFKSQ